MKKFLSLLTGLFLVFVVAGSAGATPITFNVDGPDDSYVEFTDISTGITAWGKTFYDGTTISATLSDLDGIPNFSLADNASKTIDFFTFSVNGTGIGAFELKANLNFDTPDLDAANEGEGGWVTAGSFGSAGLFLWDNASQDFILADGNVVRIEMEDGFAIGGDQDVTVHAKITNLGGAPVPEPATMLLFGIGILGLAGISRKKLVK